jgi:hypothetical protein
MGFLFLWPIALSYSKTVRRKKREIGFRPCSGFLKLWANCTTRELLPTVTVLLGIAAVVNLFSIWRFNHRQIFE